MSNALIEKLVRHCHCNKNRNNTNKNQEKNNDDENPAEQIESSRSSRLLEQPKRAEQTLPISIDSFVWRRKSRRQQQQQQVQASRLSAGNGQERFDLQVAPAVEHKRDHININEQQGTDNNDQAEDDQIALSSRLVVGPIVLKQQVAVNAMDTTLLVGGDDNNDTVVVLVNGISCQRKSASERSSSIAQGSLASSERQKDQTKDVCTSSSSSQIDSIRASNSTGALLRQRRRQRRQLSDDKCALIAQRRMHSSTKTSGPPLVWAAMGALTCALVLAMAACVSASYQSQQQQIEQQQLGLADYGSTSNELPSPPNAFQAQQANGYQQQHHSGGQKSNKKIQIVYIKVPLAKLRPALGNNVTDIGPAAYSNQTSPSSSSNYTTQQRDNTDTKSLVGSHSFEAAAAGDFVGGGAANASSSAELSQSSAGSSAQQSFLIPMALVQTTRDVDAATAPFRQPINGNELHAHASVDAIDWSADRVAVAQPSSSEQQVRPVARGQQPQTAMLSPIMQYQRLQRERALSFAAPAADSYPAPNHRPASFELHMMQPSGGSHINHGFMSGFLQAEKERMRALASQLSPVESSTNALHAPPSQSSSPQSTLATASQQNRIFNPIGSAAAAMDNSISNNHNNHNALAAGGLMPAAALAPFSRMPDNAIGQAYNAAVGRALAAESGSPAQSMLMSSSSDKSSSSAYGMASANGQLQQQQQPIISTSASSNTGNLNGGANGANGLDASSHTISSGTSYGSNGQGPSESISSASAYPSSPAVSGASSGSSNYGSGTNTYGASAAFTDYPAASMATSQAMPQQQPGNNYTTNNNSYNNNNNYNPQQSQSQTSQLDAQTAHRMRQAKKTIIPIVVQVEHAILENQFNQLNNQNNAQAQQQQPQQPTRSNRYAGGRTRNGKRGRHAKQQNGYGKGAQSLFGAATTNDVNVAAHFGQQADASFNSGAQYINAANAHDISQITAAINAENAASAAAALAAADAAFGSDLPAYIGSPQHQQQQVRQQQQQSQYRPVQSYGQNNNNNGMYSSGALQSAASALLANTHPMIQAAASGGLASVSKLGAKLGEIIALPSIPMPAISQLGQSLPTALSSLTNQMGAQLNQAAAQVAKEHPMAHAFARQVAQHAGIQLPGGSGMFGPATGNSNQNNQYQSSNHGPHQMGQQMSAASSQQSIQSVQSPQSQTLQNLKLGIGQSLQTAASQLLNTMKTEASNAQQSSAAANALGSLVSSSLLGNNQLAMQSMNAALKQLGLGPAQQAALAAMFPNSIVGLGGDQPSSATQQVGSAFNGQVMPGSGAMQFAASDVHSSSVASGEQSGKQASAGSGSKNSLKSKFLSFFSPPKFISNLLSWNDRADEREDKGTTSEIALESRAANVTSTTAAMMSSASTSSPSASTTTTTATTSPTSSTTAATSTSATTSAKAIATATETPASLATSSSKPTSTTTTTTTTTTTKKN